MYTLNKAQLRTQLNAATKCACNASEINISLTEAVAHYTKLHQRLPTIVNALCEKIFLVFEQLSMCL